MANTIARHKRIAIPNADGSFCIPLGNDRYAIIDEIDIERVTQHTWVARKEPNKAVFYAWTTTVQNGKSFSISLGRFILEPPPNKQVDHIDRNPLNNRRANIRCVSPAQNARNRNYKNKLGHVGVVFQNNKYCARIRKYGETLFFASFKTLEEAVAARKAEMQKLGYIVHTEKE
jgi:hypothetical protein